MQKVVGLILAAGASSRMGSPKPLLKIAKKTLLEDQVSRMREAGIEDIYVVVGCKANEIKERHKDLDVHWVENKEWKLGKFSSVVCGIKFVILSECNGRRISRLNASNGRSFAPLRMTPHFGNRRLHGNDIQGLLLLPVDVVNVSPEIMKKVIDEGLKSNQNIIPTFEDHGGHPVFLTSEFCQKISDKNPAVNRLDNLLNNDPKTFRLPVNSRSILNNINTLKDKEAVL